MRDEQKAIAAKEEEVKTNGIKHVKTLITTFTANKLKNADRKVKEDKIVAKRVVLKQVNDRLSLAIKNAASKRARIGLLWARVKRLRLRLKLNKGNRYRIRTRMLRFRRRVTRIRRRWTWIRTRIQRFKLRRIRLRTTITRWRLSWNIKKRKQLDEENKKNEKAIEDNEKEEVKEKIVLEQADKDVVVDAQKGTAEIKTIDDEEKEDEVVEEAETAEKEAPEQEAEAVEAENGAEDVQKEKDEGEEELEAIEDDANAEDSMAIAVEVKVKYDEIKKTADANKAEIVKNETAMEEGNEEENVANAIVDVDLKAKAITAAQLKISTAAALMPALEETQEKAE